MGDIRVTRVTATGRVSIDIDGVSESHQLEGIGCISKTIVDWIMDTCNNGDVRILKNEQGIRVEVDGMDLNDLIENQQTLYIE